jgi:lipopolysaccharide/colanic/teichoic acid biosynthesis glycosyltransferase
MIKRCFDIIFSLVGLILIFPLFLIVAIMVKLDSPGPFIYKGKRIGLLGKNFNILKFRTMVKGAEMLGGSCTASDDFRLTMVGKFLRKYKIDEIPQLINVLKGEMSFVGPRPEIKKYVDLIEEKKRKIILSVRPGMTDLASLWDFHEEDVLKGSTNPDKIYLEKIVPTKIRLQEKYVKSRSFLLDLNIIYKTIIKILQLK